MSTKRALRGDSGDVDPLPVLATDDTARCQAEARLRESEERFRGAFEFAGPQVVPAKRIW